MSAKLMNHLSKSFRYCQRYADYDDTDASAKDYGVTDVRQVREGYHAATCA